MANMFDPQYAILASVRSLSTCCEIDAVARRGVGAGPKPTDGGVGVTLDEERETEGRELDEPALG